MIKWVAAFVGFYLFRFPGALLGFFIGGMIDQLNSGTRTTFGHASQPPNREVYN
jgi:DnaJ like chaperone protein